MTLPETETLLLEQRDHELHITLNRPKTRNAMSLKMVKELMAVFESIQTQEDIRAVVLRGAEGHFCAGGDIKDMAGARMAEGSKTADQNDPFYELNREFGRMITYANQIPQVLIVVTEGAVLGGGFGLACISDVALTSSDAKFGLPETGLGIPPAQIAPFVVTRIGLTQARRLALLGSCFNGQEAKELGIVHEAHETSEALEEALESVLSQVKRCAPDANRITKELILGVGKQPLEELLDSAAHSFSQAVQGKEGQEGTMAFVQKRLPSWAE
ncbi:enoyl-CoA hydratase [Oleiphilus sp. HI0081]|uniref:enoyl-CoA hydratase/isomerase family protein n=2 Tax=Oleiphilus TaxID=141450 RepID=UPI0007C3E05C|nr:MULTISPECIES: enoyl-CoA hydratase/isomerase family protein [unclassified Oleiphilus]KZY81751.1 enoyl-CoA hydratase [Oleiphilus sp. HI0069]KZY81968.1 enoyl-CoA hydratase [Oleiphilus sp. HI0068]KZZ20427.1 enoyl-CoA hydratase [Oleiphilus sp. HI0078]KZZ23055.1 enoyl-CoA hydratase [Oleiphilus sp. HI0081]KZZ42409.1 enoyl-CoA hydratase [Oleiphilus sp. HI0085]